MTTSNKALMRAILESLDDLPETINPRDLYRPGEGDLEGRYVFGPEGFEIDGYGVGNAGKMSAALEAERKAANLAKSAQKRIERDYKAAQERLAELEELVSKSGDGVDPKELRAKIEADYKRQLDQAVAAKAQELQSVSERTQAYEKQLRDMHRRFALAQKSAKFEFDSDVLEPHLERRLQVEQDEETGEFRTRWLNASGEPGRSVSDGKEWGLDDVLADMSKHQSLGRLISARDGQPAQNNGAPRGARRPAVSNGRQRVLTPDEMNDFKTYSRIAAEAEAQGVTLIPPGQS